MWQPKHAGGIWLALVAAGGMRLPAAMAAAQSNPIVVENQQPGTTQWQIPWGSAATDGGGQIKGYASATSVNKGENITLSLSGLPSGATGSFTPNPATASSTLSVTTSTSTAPGTYTVTVTGISGTLTHTATARLQLRSR